MDTLKLQTSALLYFVTSDFLHVNVARPSGLNKGGSINLQFSEYPSLVEQPSH